MPKRSNSDKIEKYKKKLRKLEEKQKYQRLKVYSDSDESENEKTSNENQNLSIYGLEPLEEPPDLTEAVVEAPTDTQHEPEPEPGPSCSKETTDTPSSHTATTAEQPSPPEDPPLDPELLSALGEYTSDTPEFGEKIHESLAKLWLPILRKGMSKEDREKVLKQYLVPDNCRFLQAPKLNAEISAAVSETVRGRDKKCLGIQQQLGQGIAAVNRGMNVLLVSDNKVEALKAFSDSCRILSDLHSYLTKDRTKLITPSLEKNFLHVIQDAERDETLFGNKLSEKIKASKAIERQGKQIKKNPSTQKPTPQASGNQSTSSQGNWPVPRYPPNRGGRGGARKPYSQTNNRRPYNNTATQAKAPPQSKPRASAPQQ